MIVDAHTHVFPPAFAGRRAELLARDPTFAHMYGDPRARLATAEDLLASMSQAHVDVAVIAGFAWHEPEDCREHNDYLLQAAAESRGRLLAFCTLPLAHPQAAADEAAHCASLGAAGFGELRPESQATTLDDAGVAEALSAAARSYHLPLLIHSSEPVGHRYPGKDGQSIDGLYRFIDQHPEIPVIAAHWGGGLPFYALMPEVREALANVWLDTAATTLLYENTVFRTVAELLGADHILFGSDFPLLRQKRQVQNIHEVDMNADERDAILGGNACRLFGLAR